MPTDPPTPPPSNDPISDGRRYAVWPRVAFVPLMVAVIVVSTRR